MNLEEKKEVVPPIVVEPAPAPTSEPTPPEKKEETPATPPNIDYIKELEALEGTCPRCGMEQVKIGDGPLCHCIAEAKPHLPHTQND